MHDINALDLLLPQPGAYDARDRGYDQLRALATPARGRQRLRHARRTSRPNVATRIEHRRLVSLPRSLDDKLQILNLTLCEQMSQNELPAQFDTDQNNSSESNDPMNLFD